MPVTPSGRRLTATARTPLAAAESKKVVERTEKATSADKRALLKATSEEHVEALRLCSEGLRAAEERAAAAEAEKAERTAASREAEKGLEVAWRQVETLRGQVADRDAAEKMLVIAQAQSETEAVSRQTLEAGKRRVRVEVGQAGPG